MNDSRFAAFLKGETQIVADEAFTKAIQSYAEVFLRSERVHKVVHAGGFSQHDFREVRFFFHDFSAFTRERTETPRESG